MGLLARLTGSTAMTPTDAAAGAADGSLILVDVREPGEFAAAHGPHARNVPLGNLEKGSTPSRPTAGRSPSSVAPAPAARAPPGRPEPRGSTRATSAAA